MLAAFQVGDAERHQVEVYSRLIGITGLEIVRVDGVEVLRKRKFPIWFRDRLSFEVGNAEKHRVELLYSPLTMSSKVYVDDRLVEGLLFPQVIGYNALIVATLALLVAFVQAIILS